jgi:hypothetical protein
MTNPPFQGDSSSDDSKIGGTHLEVKEKDDERVRDRDEIGDSHRSPKEQ